MKNAEEIYDTFEDEDGEAYFCPVQKVADDRVVSEWEIEHCIEASTVGRYAGHVNLAGRANP